MNNITTIRGLTRTREQEAHGCFAAPTKPSLADDLGNAIWKVITCAIVPAVIIAALWQNQTEKMQYIATRSMQTALLPADRSSQAALQYPTQYSFGQRLPETPLKTPDGFAVSLAHLSHGGEYDTENQGR